MSEATDDRSRGEAGERPFTILIADDEAPIREGIRDRIDWEALGFRLVADCGDGREALAAFRIHGPDVVLSDIRMPFLDGIELTRTILTERPQTHVLLLTGHDEFEYAQAAVRLQVWDFLLKPISSKQLHDVLARLASEMVEEQRRRSDVARLRRQWEEHLPLLRERSLNELILGEGPIDDALERLDELGIAFEHIRKRVVLVAPDRGEEMNEGRRDPQDKRGVGGDLQMLALSNLVRDLLATPTGAVQFLTHDERIALVLSGDDGDLFERLDRLRRRASDRLGTSVTIGIGRAYGRTEEIRRSYRDADRALMQRFLFGGNRILSAETYDATSDATWHNHSALRAELMQRIRHVDRRGAYDALARLIEDARTTRQPIERCVLNLQRALARLLDGMEELNLDREIAALSRSNPFEEIAAMPTLDAVEPWFEALIGRMFDVLEERIGNQGELKVRSARAYLAEHYSDAGLSLTHVCAELSVSVSHFSKSFKAVTGRTFVEYLTELRIEKAKELLVSEGSRGYEIAPRVGFRDPHYFSTIFKKVCGVTPTQFRSRYAGGAERDAASEDFGGS
ncbi:MAG: response regulator [Spirochaetales bacterium]|nr:response regulator [Spirochaetales bacterium]